MNETIALTKYVWTRYRVFLLIQIPTLLLSATLTPVLSNANAPQWWVRMTASVGCSALLIGLFGSIVLFGFSRQSSLLDATSGYDTWLLRQPIANWKLAIIPSGLITIWISMICAITLFMILVLEGPDVPPLALVIVPQSLGMSGCAIATCSLVWMPFGAAWQRIVLLIFSIPLIYFVGVGAMVVFSSPLQWMMPWVAFSLVACYIASLVFAFFSVKLAWVSSFQQTKFVPASVASKPAAEAISRSFACWPDALNWYDGKRSRLSKLRQVLGILPIMGLLFWVVPVSSASAIFAMVLLAALSGIVAARFESAVWGARSSLPSYLIVSPIPSRAMATVRLRKFATEYTMTILFATLLWLTCFAWQNNRETAWRWWTSVAEANASPMVPLRMVAAIYLAILVAMLGGSLRSVCVLLRGRQTIMLWLFAACCAALMSPLIGILGWFLQQRDWEQVTHVAEDWLQWSYQFFYAAIAAKLVFNAVLVWLASKSMFSWREIVTVIVGWCVLVVAASLTWYALWPLGHVQFITALMAVSLAIPLSVCFAGPLAVQANRHLRVAG